MFQICTLSKMFNEGFPNDRVDCAVCNCHLVWLLAQESLIFWPLWWWATRLQHFLHEIETHSCFGFIFHQGKIVQHVGMAHVWCITVSVLVCEPFPLICIGMACSYIFRLEMFQLTVNVVAVPHRWFWMSRWQVRALSVYKWRICYPGAWGTTLTYFILEHHTIF